VQSPVWSSKDPALRATGITRSFGAVQALLGVSLDVFPGRVTALVGDNGAGKSTMVKILAGADTPDDGDLVLNGQPVAFRDPTDARSAGIECVYQDLAIAPDLNVVQNLYLGREVTRSGVLGVLGLLDRQRMRVTVREALGDLAIEIPSVETEMRYLSGGQRQAVAVARSVMWASRVVILDEPTAALGITEREAVLNLIARVKDRGLAVLLVSHSLPEVFQIADHIVVLRHGAKVAQLQVSETSMDEVVGYMTGARYAA